MRVVISSRRARPWKAVTPTVTQLKRPSITLKSAFSSVRKSLRRGERSEVEVEVWANKRYCSKRRKVPLDQRERASKVLGIYRFSRHSNARITRSFSRRGRTSNYNTDSRTSPASHRIAARHHSWAPNEQNRFFQDVELLRKGVVYKLYQLFRCPSGASQAKMRY